MIGEKVHCLFPEVYFCDGGAEKTLWAFPPGPTTQIGPKSPVAEMNCHSGLDSKGPNSFKTDTFASCSRKITPFQMSLALLRTACRRTVAPVVSNRMLLYPLCKKFRCQELTCLLTSAALAWRSIATQTTRNLANKDEQLESLSMAPISHNAPHFF